MDSRRWAVEALALAGTDQSVDILLKSMHDDASPVVRERAACGLAESGMFTHEQRFAAVPTLLTYIDEQSLDAQTRGWSFQALGDITHQRLPNESSAWRTWYEKQHRRPAIAISARRSMVVRQSAIFATCRSNPVFGNNDVSENALNPSPSTSVCR